MTQLRVAFQRFDRGRASLRIAGRVEVEAVALAEPPVTLGAKIGARLRQREIDVEEDGAK